MEEEKITTCDYCRREFKISELKWVRTTSVLACSNCMAGAVADFDAFCEEDD